MRPTGSNSFKGRRSRLGRSLELNEGLDKRLASYAAAARAAEVGRRARASVAAEVITRAASAAGVGLLLSAGPASARIVYTPAYATVHLSTTPLPLDLNHDGITDFALSWRVNSYHSDSMHVSPVQAGNAILGKTQGVLSQLGAPFTCRVASALPAGHLIGPGNRFGAYRTMFAWLDSGSIASSVPRFSVTCGYWKNAQGRFLGLEFTAQGQKHFGWARLNGNGCCGFSAHFTLTGYAYETDPNKPIRAGDTGSVADARVPQMDRPTHSVPPTVATLTPATLGLLALGSAGLDIWRKEQER
jgi:hypothetical protein